ncbi:hypothetical protein GCM10023213_25190 [Prosthecobacter algae]|uniref:GYF domain-containing protein n=1 Tax=Prosthecobacter algae TaxID=1144682 RepID=A0ABP9P698_9BACT
MNVYWLSRDGASPAEGPYAMGQLKRMYEAGQAMATAQICRQGETDWLPLVDELDHEEALHRQMTPKPAAARREASFEEAMRQRDTELAKGYGLAINVVTTVICLTGLVPLIGLFAYVVWSVWAMVATALCLMQMSKGQASSGIWNLVRVWIFAPLIIGGLQFVSLRLLAASQ